MEELRISTKTKDYQLFIGSGLRHQLQDLLGEQLLEVSSILIITDRNVGTRYMDEVASALGSHDYVHWYTVEPGEGSKDIAHYYDCLTFCMEKGLDRKSLIFALGGGVIGDLAGFVAATYMRGIPFVQLPTSLLAHDSAVGGKTGINHPLGKNMIGAFHQPSAVVFDIDMLDSLPEREWRSGFAEIIKHALIKDADFFEWLQQHISSLTDLRGEKLTYALKKGIEVKAAVVREDEQEKGVRAILNFGHTLGHAIEAEAGYGALTHGDAVAIGMKFAIKLSERYYRRSLGAGALSEWMNRFGYGEIPEGLTTQRLLSRMKLDKKASGGNINMIMLKQIGEVEIVSVPDQPIVDLLTDELERKR